MKTSSATPEPRKIPPYIPNAWITSTQIVDKAGHALSARVLNNECPGLGQGAPGPAGGLGGAGGSSHREAPPAAQQTLHDCVVKVGATYHEVVKYQPANRYWPLQCYELAIFVGAAVILAGASIWWVRRRLT